MQDIKRMIKSEIKMFTPIKWIECRVHFACKIAKIFQT